MERGIDVVRIDKVLKKFGFPMGPFEMLDLSGLDVSAYVGNIYSKVYSERMYFSSLIPRLVKASMLGRSVHSQYSLMQDKKQKLDSTAIKIVFPNQIMN